jgi:hypothetical protein
MIVSMWNAGEQSPFTRRSMVAESGIAEADFAALVDGLGAGAQPTRRWRIASSTAMRWPGTARIAAPRLRAMSRPASARWSSHSSDPNPIGDIDYFAASVLAGRPAGEGARAG